MVKLITIRALEGYRLYLEYSDGTRGDVDLSDLVGRGVFRAWRDQEFFRQAHLGNHREVRWSEEIELCPDSLYLKLTGKSPDQLFTSLQHESSHA